MRFESIWTPLGLTLMIVVGIVEATPITREHPDLPVDTSQWSRSNSEKTTQYWVDGAQKLLAAKLQKLTQRNTNRAKNIILFLGDGMSVPTVTATRKFLGDSSRQVSFERFPYVGLSKTYAINERVPDSASTATAYLNGVKANYGTIGVNGQVPYADCYKGSSTSTHTESLAKWAQDAGKWAGLVTTARVTHASPAGVYAHTAKRSWEHNTAIEKDGCDAELNVDIARQLVEWSVGRELRVVLGGGRNSFRDISMLDEEDEPGKRTDGRDLIDEWLWNKHAEKRNASYVWSKKGLQSVDLENTEYLLGLFSPSHCPYHGDLKRTNQEASHPSLSEMTEKAIQLLSKNREGFFLFVEGAKIDMAHHSTRAQKSLEDTAEFARAVEVALNLTSPADTLIVVTSDHSHTMTINGYPVSAFVTRENNIFGLAPTNADDGLPYTILSYANGPGYSKTYSEKTGRKDLQKAKFNDPKYQYMATVPLKSETHGGEDVGVFALGPYEHYFTGNYEQTIIPALMAFAANIGPFKAEYLMEDIE